MSLLQLGRIIDFTTWVTAVIYRIKEIFNGGISPADNFTQVVFRGVTPGVAGTEFTLEHRLNRGPPRQDSSGNWLSGVEFVYWLDGAGTLYESDFNNWTDNAIKLKCTDASRGYTIIVR